MTQNRQWLLIVGIVIGAIGVVAAGSAVGTVLGDEPTQDRTGVEHPHASGDQYDTTHAHADDDWQHHHGDDIENHPPDDDGVRGPHHSDAESPTRGGPCH